MPFVFNIAAGKVAAYYDNVESGSPANAALVIVPLETSGLESDAVLKDKDTLADVLAGATNEQTTLGRVTLTAAQLAAIPAPDDTNDRNERSLPTFQFAGNTGNPISKILVCYDPDTTSGTDANLVPLTAFEYAATPSGLAIEVTGGVFFRANT